MPLTPAQFARELTPTPAGSESARGFYQSRVSLFFFVIGGLSLVFFLLHNLLEVMSGNLTFVQVFTFPLNHWQLGGIALSGVLGLAARYAGRTLNMSALAWIDVGGTVAVLTCDAMMGTALLGVSAPHFDLVLTLVFVLFQMTRAVIVPSTVRRTIVACAVGAIPMLVMGWLLARYAPDAWSSNRVIYAPLYVGLWCLDSAIPAALASSVIYGLRQQVREARQLGQYTLEERLGEGGMGTVYRARHALLRRPTAVKLLRPERTSERALLRFEREVRLTSQLNHPNTVSIYDYGRTANGVFYYAMEYLDGLDLQRLIEVDGPQPPARVIHVLRQVCGALNEAHGLGLIHRDIKPANIIVCEHGGARDVVKVVDFGLVKTFEADEPDLSVAEVIVGTPHFLAPEAIRSPSAVDARTDIYSLGAVAYFLLAGTYVFEGDGVMDVCLHHLNTQPLALSKRAPAVPAALEAVVMRCLAKDPAERPQTALALLNALVECGVPEWRDAEAEVWWLRRQQQRNSRAPQSAPARTPTLLEVDVGARARLS
jgi:serine/threonine-protein kinase